MSTRKLPFKKVLIANRGEIAVRVIRACHELGVKTVAVHSTADADALHVKLAHESVCIGPPAASESYLNISALISAAVATGAEAIHPGYGFLSENAAFAEICGQCGITFIGPKERHMRLMGDKAVARRLAMKHEVPVVPGSAAAGTNVDEALQSAHEIGFPVLIKAVAGGGGRGMKIVHQPEEFARLFDQASREVEAAFGDPSLYIEKFIARARHVEVQIIGDSHHNVIHLGERDCSTQRRYQKLVEESPAPMLSDATRAAMHQSAVHLGKSIGYTSCGTLEYLLDPATEKFYFIEMNTRLQVEHPVTEMVTLTDIVKEQIWVAAGQPLSFKQEDISFRGHAIEVRVNAEDPYTFVPSPGLVDGYHPPGGLGVRVESAIYDRYRIPPFYDSLIAKIICRGHTREEAIQKMLVALSECIIGGVTTNQPLLIKILENPEFAAGRVHTKLLDVIFENEKQKTAKQLVGNAK
ncbi:MAG TPA: acetyl-CoA carboxylase biotin carboxylase subunit [Oligoflexia bacterium]|nr:acetyl-CoA carboxylase biotin carboxylase subunit [Oligoflexia bacterium]HMP48644.1 acetyl-CoA carboxylase biotin carboxylase subunit [Oligoflexia bacterium]